jgi:hypothetical protein
MPCVGFEPMILASKRAKTVHNLDNSPTLTSSTPGTKWKSMGFYILNYDPETHWHLNTPNITIKNKMNDSDHWWNNLNNEFNENCSTG